MSKWLEEDINFRNASGKYAELAIQLNMLASHLMLWHAKFEAWIPDNVKHALLYMDDEEAHGLGFPHGIEYKNSGELSLHHFHPALFFSS
jgi:hypothetical protein